ncbi:helix-turn-helix transcriptional regulator [Amycolatopsis sp. cmx-4-54]|uniref:helix-turn-helix transcriptional regulator n=1 Tax=Amycolatopsis sp. cmx-4-54 TaxID=2790936 RepID=UPI00397A0B40
MTRRDGLAQARDAIGHSQDSLAAELEVTGKTVSNWERGYSKPTRRNELQLARILKLTHQQVIALIEPDREAANPAPVTFDIDPRRSQAALLDGLRRSIIGARGPVEESSGLDELARAVNRVHRHYQYADYEAAAKQLPKVIVQLNDQPDEPQMAAQKACAYVAGAKLATKLGCGSLAWLAADRANHAAMESENRALVGISRYQIACALLLNGYLDDALHLTGEALEDLAATTTRHDQPMATSAKGALLLLASVMAARTGDSGNAREFLLRARDLAESFGREGNALWTGFGPTNVAIHELSVAVQLGDVRRSYELGSVLDTDRLPRALVGRRSQVHLDLGRAAMGAGDDGLAVLHLLEAERVAKQAVSHNANARETIRTLLDRERRNATPGLRALAMRAGVHD